MSFSQVDSLVFLEIAYNISLQQCLTSSGIKSLKKIFGSKFGPKGLEKIGLETRFFAIFSSFVHYFLFKLHRMVCWNNV